MRAFVSVDLPDDVKDKIYKMQKEIGNEGAKIRWVHKKNLHITLKFFREISQANAERIAASLKEIKFTPFKMKPGGFGFFPSKESIRVIWIELIPANNLMNLQGEVDEKLCKLFPREKSFKAHLSLGRVRLIKNKEKFTKAIDSIKIPDIEFEVSGFKLIESILTKDGPVYKTLEVF